MLISGTHTVIHAYSTLMPLVYPLALTELHFSLTALGVMVAVASLAGGFLQLGAGAVTRVIRRHTLLGWGAVGMAVASAITAVATSFTTFFLGNVLRSIATSAQHPIGNSLLSDLYPKARHGMAIAGHVAGGNVGTVLLTPLAGVILTSWGWRTATLALTVPAILAGIAVLSGIQEAPRAARPTTALGDMLAALRHLRTSSNLRLIFLASLIAAGGRGLGVVILIVPLYLSLRLHMAPGTVTLLYALLLIGSVAGPLIGGPLSDRVGRRSLLVVAYPLSALTTMAVLLVPGTVLWLAPALLAMGLVVYVESPLLQTLLADQAPPEHRDAIFSLYFAVVFGIGALWAAAVGVALSRLGFGPVFVIMAASYLGAAACVLLIRERRTRPVGMAR